MLGIYPKKVNCVIQPESECLRTRRVNGENHSSVTAADGYQAEPYRFSIPLPFVVFSPQVGLDDACLHWEGNLLHWIYQFKCWKHLHKHTKKFSHISGYFMNQSSWHKISHHRDEVLPTFRDILRLFIFLGRQLTQPRHQSILGFNQASASSLAK